jgi:cobalt-zinc-cadmium efflux system protein
MDQTMTRSKRLSIVLGVNLALVVVQVVVGLAARSTGLLADAGHNLTDVAAVGVSLAAVRWALGPRSDARTFGNHRGTILAALLNAAGLAVVTGVIVAIAVVRLVHPRPVDGTDVAVVAAIATVANGGTALLLGLDHRDRHDLNIRSVLLHVTSDMLASLCVLVAGIVIVATGGGGWVRIDPAASLVVALMIVAGAVRLTKQSVDVLLESTPRDIDLGELRAAITAAPGVGEVHDLHVWSLSSDVRALSAHLVLTGHPSLHEAQLVGIDVRQRVIGPFAIAHTTFELECERCADDEDDPCMVDERNGALLDAPGRDHIHTGHPHHGADIHPVGNNVDDGASVRS